MGNKFVAEGYDKVAENYSAGRDLFKNNKYLDLLSKYLKPEAKILDIGCGAGIPIDKYLIDKGYKVTGIDISPKQIELAKKNVSGAQFAVKDMEEISSKEFSLDAVVSFYAIFHIKREKHLELLKIISSFLPPGGMLLITMGSSDWEGMEQFHGTKMFWSHFGAKKNVELVKSAGFEIVKEEIDTSGGEKHLVILGKKI